MADWRRPERVLGAVSFASLPPGVLVLNARRRAPWVLDALDWMDDMGNRATSIAAEAVCASWLQQNLWVFYAVAPWANVLLIEDVFAGDVKTTVRFLQHVRKTRCDLLVVGTFEAGRGDLATYVTLCDATLELPATRETLQAAFLVAQMRPAGAGGMAADGPADFPSPRRRVLPARDPVSVAAPEAPPASDLSLRQSVG